MADRFATGGYTVIVDGIVGPWFLDPFRALERDVTYVVLRPALEAAEQRAADRGEHPLKDLAVVGQMHAASSDLGELEAPRHRLHVAHAGPRRSTRSAAARPRVRSRLR